MGPGNFAVPGALLQTAGDGQTGEVADLDRPPPAPVPGRTHWYDGVVVAFVLLVMFGAGVGGVLGGLGLALLLVILLRLLGPVQARAEEQRLLVADGLPAETAIAPAQRLHLFAVSGRLGRRRGMQDLMALAVPLGSAALAVALFGGRVLERNLGLNTWQRYAVLASVAMAALLIGPAVAFVLDGFLRGTPELDRRLAGIGTAVCCLCVGIAGTVSSLGWFVALTFIGEAFIFVVARGVSRCVTRTVSARERFAAWWLLWVYAALVGALVGGILLDLVAARESPRWALALVAPIGLAVGAWVLSGAGRAATDREAHDVVLSVRERRLTQERTELGLEPPAIEVAHVDFSFGSQPVLRDVSLEVWSGEVVALLGTNGAGKSTLLRVIAGLLVPERGTVRLVGEPTELIGPEALGRRGIALVLGGNMTFPGLTVADTLRLSLAGLAKPDDLEQVYGRFPVLWHRRNQRTGTLSGGEQQMLALGRALLARPKLLLIDELSLGLAPKIVAELVELVEEVNARGTTVVLVEQSVNVATSLASHAFFLERGEVRFDGPIDDLLDRDDLLRSVFLAGAK
ncbi:MAG: ATP-binding cassette domain-containing protein [Actinomycetes bacterium]